VGAKPSRHLCEYGFGFVLLSLTAAHCAASDMSDNEKDEISDAEKLKIAGNFVFHSPPGQTSKVVDDVRTLLGPVLTDGALSNIVQRVNKDKFLQVTVPGTSREVLLTPTGELPQGNFLDPEGQQILIVDHPQQKCVGVKPLDAAQRAQCEGTEAFRSSVDTAMKTYVAEYLPNATVTTYARKAGGSCQVICCVGRCNMELSNFWSGLWRSQWMLDISPDASSGVLSGFVACHVHYFEDGNVQLQDSTKFEQTIQLQSGDVGASFVKQVTAFESEFVAGLEAIYQTMSESVLNALRRRLPITKVKFDWENKASVHKLASELNAFKAS